MSANTVDTPATLSDKIHTYCISPFVCRVLGCLGIVGLSLDKVAVCRYAAGEVGQEWPIGFQIVADDTEDPCETGIGGA